MVLPCLTSHFLALHTRIVPAGILLNFLVYLNPFAPLCQFVACVCVSYWGVCLHCGPGTLGFCCISSLWKFPWMLLPERWCCCNQGRRVNEADNVYYSWWYEKMKSWRKSRALWEDFVIKGCLPRAEDKSPHGVQTLAAMAKLMNLRGLGGDGEVGVGVGG